jgi:hypothetical protein
MGNLTDATIPIEQGEKSHLIFTKLQHDRWQASIAPTLYQSPPFHAELTVTPLGNEGSNTTVRHGVDLVESMLPHPSGFLNETNGLGSEGAKEATSRWMCNRV